MLLLRISFSGELAYEIHTPAGYGTRVWEAALAAGASEGIVPYGTEAMGALRIEKGHVAGPELDGRTTPDNLGLGRMASRKKDYVGRAALTRPALTAADRLQLVGLLARDGRSPIRSGARVVANLNAPPPVPMLGHVTSADFSPTLAQPIALALLAGGRARGGETLHAMYPLRGEATEVVVSNPVFVIRKGCGCVAEPGLGAAAAVGARGAGRRPRTTTEVAAVSLHERHHLLIRQIAAWRDGEVAALRAALAWCSGFKLAGRTGCRRPGRPPHPADRAAPLVAGRGRPERRDRARVGAGGHGRADRTAAARPHGPPALGGAAAGDVLAKLCRIDLHQRALPTGRVVENLLAQVPALIHALWLASFDLYLPRSLAISAAASVIDAAEEFGVAFE